MMKCAGSTQGASLVEQLVALLVLLTVALPLLEGLLRVKALSRHSRTVSIASSAAESCTQRLVGSRFDVTSRGDEAEAATNLVTTTVRLETACSSSELEPGLISLRVDVRFSDASSRGEGVVSLARLYADPIVALRGHVPFD